MFSSKSLNCRNINKKETPSFVHGIINICKDTKVVSTCICVHHQFRDYSLVHYNNFHNDVDQHGIFYAPSVQSHQSV